MRGRESFVFPASLCIRLKRYLLHKPYRPPAPPDDPILLESPILEEPVPEPIALGPLIPAPVWPWIVSGICPDPPNLASPPICGGPPVPYCPITDDDSLPGLIVWLTSAPPGGVILEGPPPIVVSPVGVPVWDPSSCAWDEPPVNKSIPLVINIYAHICRNLMEALLDNVCGQISKSSCKMETLSPTVSIRPWNLDYIGLLRDFFAWRESTLQVERYEKRPF